MAIFISATTCVLVTSSIARLHLFHLIYHIGYCIYPVPTYRFSILIGPITHIKHLASRERLPFSLAYVGSLAATLYFALGVSDAV